MSLSMISQVNIVIPENSWSNEEFIFTLQAKKLEYDALPLVPSILDQLNMTNIEYPCM